MKRAELNRTTPLRTASPDAARVKLRKCAVKECRREFMPISGWQLICTDSFTCALAWREQEAAKREAKKAKREAAEHRAKLADSRRLSHWLGLTERVVNHFIQTRDKGKPCISCGTHRTVRWEAGHFLSVGARPELRFVAKNINLQCHRCNVHLSGNQAAYRPGLVAKFGLGAVEALEGPHATAKYTREALEELRKQFAAETRNLKAQR